MLRYHLLLILCLFVGAEAQGQVALSYCVDLKSVDVPAVKMGRDFLASNASPVCSGYCASRCEFGLLDPVGGFELGYYLYKDKAAEAWALHYQIDSVADGLMEKLVTNADYHKHKLQGGKEGHHLLTVPANEALATMQDELVAVWESSRRDFQGWQNGRIPQGDLARVFSKLEVADGQATLTLDYRISNRMHAIYASVAEQLFQIFPQYDRRAIDDTTSQYYLHREWPSIKWIAYPSQHKMELTISKPEDKNPPRLGFGSALLKPSLQGMDTLVSEKIDGKRNYYSVQVSDQSEVKTLRFGSQVITLEKHENLSYGWVEATPDLNRREVTITVADEHGHDASKKVFLLQYEDQPPRFQLLDLKDNTYKKASMEVVLDKFGGRFALIGQVKDESPIRYLRINQENVPLDEENRFNHPLKPSDNNKSMRVEVADAHGNRVYESFTLKFKESGDARSLKQVVLEDFSSTNPSHLVRQGQQQLKLWIQDDRFYLQRQPTIDSGASAEAQNSMAVTEHQRDALVPLGIQALDFNSDFELNVTYKEVEPNSQFFFAFGINDPQNSYYFVYGERDNLFLGQMDNGVVQCFGEGCLQNAYNRIYTRYSYLTREQVKPNFFDQGNSVNYSLTIKRYNQFYLGALDDPQDYLFVKIDNGGLDPAKELRYKLSGGNARITGSKCGFGLGEKAFIGIDKFTFKKGTEKEISAFYDEKDAEKVCMETCFKVDPEKKDAFFDCISDDYHALIIANGEFENGLNPLDSAVARGKRLYDLLVNEYQFKEENVEFKPNMGKNEFLATIETKLPKSLTKKDKLLVFIISHGSNDKHIAFRDGQVSSSYLFNVLNEKTPDPKYKCKQILVVIDACFSGEMAPTQQSETNPNRLVCDAFLRGSRILLTSASKTTTKDSELTKAILNKLETNPDRFLSIDKLFDQAREGYNRAMQGTAHPTITIFEPSSNEPNGSFLFLKKKFYH